MTETLRQAQGERYVSALTNAHELHPPCTAYVSFVPCTAYVSFATDNFLNSVLILIWFAGIGGLIMVFHHIWGYTILDLSPEWTQIRYELLGLGFSRRVPTAAITQVKIVHRSTINDTFHIEGIDMCAGRKSLKLGSHLPTEEKKWLVAEINQYLSTLETPKELSGLTARLRVTSQGIGIAMTVRNESERFGVLALWLTVWSIGGAFSIWKVVSSIINGEFIVAVFLSPWLVFWLMGEIYAIRTLAWNLFGEENILLSEEHLTIRLAPRQYRRKGKLLFDYETQSISFCKHVSDAEAQTLLKHLTDIMAFHCHSTERIIFGDHQIPVEGPSTTLHNPDVSELTFPFVRLKQLIIYTDSYNFHQVERFFTYAINYIGQKKLKNHVEVLLYGDPGKIHPNLQNSFQNVFKSVRHEA